MRKTRSGAMDIQETARIPVTKLVRNGAEALSRGDTVWWGTNKGCVEEIALQHAESVRVHFKNGEAEWCDPAELEVEVADPRVSSESLQRKRKR